MGMGINDKIGNGNGKEWETTCMGMGMPLIPMGIHSHWRMPCLVYFLARKRKIPFFTRESSQTALARLSHRISVRPSVCHTGGSVKNGAS